MKVLLLILVFANAALMEPSARGHRNRNHHHDHSFLIQSNNLPKDLNWMPILSNGHLGVQVMGTSVYMDGLYNGFYGLSHRARIPNYSNLQIDLDNTSLPYKIQYSMNFRNGIFKTFIRVKEHFVIKHIVYAHRFYTRAIVNQIIVVRFPGNNEEIKIPLNTDPGKESTDIVFDKEFSINFTSNKERSITGGEPKDGKENDSSPVTSKCGHTSQVEDPIYQEKRKHVCVLWNHVPEELTLGPEERTATYKFIMTVDEDLYVAKQEMMDVLSSSDQGLLRSHLDAWNEVWNSFSIDVDGDDLELSQSISASLYALISALPSFTTNQTPQKFGGLSPTGLGRGGGDLLNDYEGHNFWDTEIWMQPSILLMNPDWSQQLLDYRFDRLRAARDFARSTSFKGARFPWESASTGRDVTQPCCPSVASNEQHISADVLIALENHFAATHDLHWLREHGCELTRDVATFLADRVQLNETTHLYDIRGVMGPDEDHESVDNNFYTNVAFKRALNFASYLSSFCNFTDSGNWSEIASKITIPFDSNLDYHPQFEDYKIGTSVKQADAILGGYPLQFDMDLSTRKNDLKYYENVTRSTGPAMTWSMFAINFLDVNDPDKGQEYFHKSYAGYLQAPFLVWSEISEPERQPSNGAVNFLTGAGGFLQSILNGFCGMRLFVDRLEITNPRLPASARKIAVNGIKYLGVNIDLVITAQNSRLRFRDCITALDIIVNGTKQAVQCKRQYTSAPGGNFIVKRAT